ncbi:MAG: DUF2914 domain-containing protein [Acidobacteriota bacterium]
MRKRTPLLMAILLLLPLAAARSLAAAEPAAVRVVACTGVADRAPTGAASTFPADVGHVWCFCEIRDAGAGMDLTHLWTLNGKIVARIPLKASGARWRTWSEKKILPAETGRWKVAVLDASGKELGSVEFEVGSAGASAAPAKTGKRP